MNVFTANRTKKNRGEKAKQSWGGQDIKSSMKLVARTTGKSSSPTTPGDPSTKQREAVARRGLRPETEVMKPFQTALSLGRFYRCLIRYTDDL